MSVAGAFEAPSGVECQRGGGDTENAAGATARWRQEAALRECRVHEETASHQHQRPGSQRAAIEGGETETAQPVREHARHGRSEGRGQTAGQAGAERAGPQVLPPRPVPL